MGSGEADVLFRTQLAPKRFTGFRRVQMKIKQAIAAALLLIPMAAISVATKPASAHEVIRRVDDRRVVVIEAQRYRRIWVPGHWRINRFGERCWVPGRYVYYYR